MRTAIDRSIHRIGDIILRFPLPVSHRIRFAFFCEEMAQESWKETDQTECQMPEEPILCANNCGFFGSALTNNLCSKCYRNLVMDQQSMVAPVISHVEKSSIVASSSVQPEASTEGIVKLDAVSAVNPDDQVEEECSKKPTNRCFQCRKRVGLTGFKCRCGGTFCSSHRYFKDHECSFDYKTAGRDTIAKQNPVVKAEKIEKI